MKKLIWLILVLPVIASAQMYVGPDGYIHIRNADNAAAVDSSRAAGTAYAAAGALLAAIDLKLVPTDTISFLAYIKSLNLLKFSIADSSTILTYIKSLEAGDADSTNVAHRTDSTTFNATKTNIRHEATYCLFKGSAITSTKWYTMSDGTNMSATVGICMPAAGYLWAVSQTSKVTAETTPGTYYTRIMAYRGGVNQWVCDMYDTTAGIADYKDWFTNSNPAVYPFQAGDILNGQIAWGTLVGTITGTWTYITVRFTTPQEQ